MKMKIHPKFWTLENNTSSECVALSAYIKKSERAKLTGLFLQFKNLKKNKPNLVERNE